MPAPTGINLVINVFDEEEDCELAEIHKVIGFVLTDRNEIKPLILSDSAQLIPVFENSIANFYFDEEQAVN